MQRFCKEFQGTTRRFHMISLLFEPQALAEQSDDRRFAFDSYRRFIQMYADVVLGIEVSHFEKMLERAKQKRGVKQAGDSLFLFFFDAFHSVSLFVFVVFQDF